MKYPVLLFILSIYMFFNLTSCQQKAQVDIRNDFKTYYDQYKVAGSFLLYDEQKDAYTVYNEEQLEQMFTPASTFKICNSLIGLETGVIQDENFVIPWDSVMRDNRSWNQEHKLQTAYKNSVVWYYQELARRVGATQMKYWLDKVAYGNRDTAGGIDLFWLSGGLRISPRQQIDFLKRLHHGDLPFSPRAMDIVKSIMIAKETPEYTIRAKTGWGFQDNQSIGWYVGYVLTKDNVYYFSNCLQAPSSFDEAIAKGRIDIVEKILVALEVIRD